MIRFIEKILQQIATYSIFEFYENGKIIQNKSAPFTNDQFEFLHGETVKPAVKCAMKLLIHSHFQTPTAAPFRKYAFIYPCSHLSQNMLVKGAPWYQWWHNSIDRECQYHNPVTDDIRYHDMETLYASLVVWIGNPPAISGSNDKSIWWLVFHVFSQSILIQFTVIWQHSNCRLSDTQVRSCDVTVMKQIHK